MSVKILFQYVILAQRFWQALSGILLVAFLTRYLSIAQQGWYYSFISLSSLYTIFDLGLSVVILQLSAHYFVGNEWGRNGSLSGKSTNQFLSLLNQSLHLYLKLGFLFCLLMIPAGIIFFGLTSTHLSFDISWHFAWIVLAIATTLNIFLFPIFSAIEGSGSISEVYLVRLVQGVVGSIACWIVLASGGFLWAASMIPLSAFLVAVSWLLMSRPILLRDAFKHSGSHISWSSEVWPLQWRIGLSWLSGYLLTQIYTPILFHYQGAEVAGQMGLSLTLANMLGILAQSWIARRVPSMAEAVSHKNWQAFDQIFRRDFIVSVAFYLLGVLGFCVLYHLISDTQYVERILSFWPFLGLLLVVLINHINGALAAHLRSYKKEPLVWVSLGGTILTVPIAVISAAYYSVSGVVNSILLVQLLLTLPLSVHLWIKYNREWRQ
jgi:hypothetical protein